MAEFLHGLKDVKRELRRLEPKLQKNIMRGAVAEVSRQIRDEARRNAPVKTGNLRRNIVARRRRGRRHVMRSSVIVRQEGKRGDKKNAFYWRFVEFGHVDRSGRLVPGRAFITKAYESGRGRVDEFMTTYARRRFEQAMRR